MKAVATGEHGEFGELEKWLLNFLHIIVFGFALKETRQHQAGTDNILFYITAFTVLTGECNFHLKEGGSNNNRRQS